MCTVAWGQTGQRLWVCFNRDEQRSRAAAEPPQVHELESGKGIYARDPVGGGTWFAVSQAGYVVALLNHYPESGAATESRPCSRGGIVTGLVGEMSAEHAKKRIEEGDYTSHAPFYLFLLSPKSASGYEWDGTSLKAIEYGDAFWTSSSYRPKEVADWRHEWWRRHFPEAPDDAATVGELMRRAVLEKPTHGVTMDRDLTRTVSQIEVSITEAGIDYRYHAREEADSGYMPAQLLHLKRDR